jgi:glutamyl/glutaminyl-tRNA synthetase
LPQTRILVSASGPLRLEEARAALLNWLLARSEGGACRLVIDDLSPPPEVQPGEGTCLEALDWLGLRCAGDPVRRSERRGAYRSAQDSLEGRGLAPGLLFAPPRGRTLFEDLVRWEVLFDNAEAGDFSLADPEEIPAAELMDACDAADLGITHVLRPEAEIRRSLRQVLLGRALDQDPPAFGHLPLLAGPGGRPFGEEEGATDVLEYRQAGALPGALLDHLARTCALEADGPPLGLEEMTRAFDPERIRREPEAFDTGKLLERNAAHLDLLDPAALAGLCRPFLQDQRSWKEAYAGAGEERAWFLEVLDLSRRGAETLGDVADAARPFLFEGVSWEAGAVREHLLREPLQAARRVRALHQALAGLQDWDAASLSAALAGAAGELGVEEADLAGPLGVGLTGRAVGEAYRAAALLGRERSLERIDALLRFLEHDPEVAQARRAAEGLIPPPE